MKCSYHPATDIQAMCTACNRPLCTECAHKIKGKVFCQDCLIEGAEWATTVKRLQLPSDAPRRAAICALIPGMGAVYNNEYLKALTYFAVFASLIMMGGRISWVFGFGACTFLVFTIFDAYRTAESKTRRQLETTGVSKESSLQDNTIIAWGIFLILLGILFLLQNIIDYYFLTQLWPLVFILLGAYLVFRSLRDRKVPNSRSSDPLFHSKEDR